MRARQILLINLLGIIVVVAALVGGYLYFYNQNNYIHENDAYVSVDSQYVVGTVTGKLTKWNVQEGTSVKAGDVVGVESLPTGQTMNITAPIGGQVLKNAAVNGEVITPGAMLCAIGDLANEYVVANVKETQIKDVKAGQQVDVNVDAYPGNTFSGTVQSIGSESAANASSMPTTTSGTFTKEVQRVPVKISIDGLNGKYIVPKMNATVRIHK